ncbi:MAG: endonuclease domain-containing protein [Thiohalomonadales bacterium]
MRGLKILTTRARDLRKNSTDAEQLLWKHLRGRRLEGFKFKRQLVIEPYIVDFVCLDVKLIVEADGGQHSEQIVYDNKRTTRLEYLGYRVLRFWNNDILNETQSVLETIRLALIEVPSPQPSPGGRGS